MFRNLGPYGSLYTATDAATVTFDLANSPLQVATLGGNRTLALANVQAGQPFTLLLKQDATGGRTVTWFSGISWQGGTAPTLTATAAKTDTFQFICTAPGAYLGYVAGQNA